MNQVNPPTGTLRSLMERTAAIGQRPDDTRGLKTRKTTLVITTIIGAIVVIPWGIFYVGIGLVFTGMIPLFYATLSAVGIIHFHRTKDDRFLRYGQTILFLLLPTLVHITLGGFVNSSGVVMFSIIGVLGAVSYADTKHGGIWIAGYAVVVLALVPIDPILRTWAPSLSENFIAAFLAINILLVSLLVYLLTLVSGRARSRLAAELAEERERSERLLLNVLPASIAARLITANKPIADRYDNVAILSLTSSTSPPLLRTFLLSSLSTSSMPSSPNSTRLLRPAASRRSRPSETPTWS